MKKQLDVTCPSWSTVCACVCACVCARKHAHVCTNEDGPSGGEDLLMLARTTAWWGKGQDLFSLWGAAPKYHKLSGLNKRNLSFHSSGGWRSKAQVLARPCSHGLLGKDLFLTSLPASASSLAYGYVNPIFIVLFVSGSSLFIRTPVTLD